MASPAARAEGDARSGAAPRRQHYLQACQQGVLALGVHLLFTDLSTSPRTELGRMFFGVLYGLSTVLLYDLPLSANTPGLPA